jgi:hypothetical protein
MTIIIIIIIITTTDVSPGEQQQDGPELIDANHGSAHQRR